MSAVTAAIPRGVERREIESVVIRFAGDSGDGVQITGSQFTDTTALAGNDLATFPDFPAEIRAPAGTTFGVSAFQINFGARSIATAGDAPDVLVAFNPAALKVNLGDLHPGGLIVVDTGTFGRYRVGQRSSGQTGPAFLVYALRSDLLQDRDARDPKARFGRLSRSGQACDRKRNRLLAEPRGASSPE